MRKAIVFFSRGARWLAVGFAAATLGVNPPARGDEVFLHNGLRLEGKVGNIASVGKEAIGQKATGNVETKRIALIDDDLRRIFVGSQGVKAIEYGARPGVERIKIDQRVAAGGQRIGAVGPIVSIEPWSDFGHRTIVMVGPKGNIPVVQGITEITPTYTKVEGLLLTEGSYIWDMRIATSSIPRATLSKILLNQLDRKKSDDRLRVVRLYIESERYQDAWRELDGVIKDFPDLADLKRQKEPLQQKGARRMIKEIEQRRTAGQHELALHLLSNFPREGAAGETMLLVRDMLADYDKLKKEGERAVALFDTHVAALKELRKDETAPARLAPILAEINRDLNIHTLGRLDDYLRLADDESRDAEQKLALAVSGWLMGSGSGIENLNMAISMVTVRDLVAKYLGPARPHERDAILAELKSTEGAEPRYVAKIIALLAPPMKPENVVAAEESQETQEPAEEPVAEAPEDGAEDVKEKGAKAGAKGNGDDKLLLGAAKAKPVKPASTRKLVAKVAGGEVGVEPGQLPPGCFRLRTPGLTGEPDVTYLVQTPPEYHPARRYPCVVTLHGSGTSASQQLSWWAGDHDPKTGMRLGQASRQGYIVIAPEWARKHQNKYEYSAREHSTVIYSLRDACRRFSIDTDRTFLSGHSMGGDAAWDIGLSHPDLWAGMLPVVATAGKYVKHYHENGRMLPMYFVCGEKDGDRMQLNSSEFDRYLTRSKYDAMVIDYQGRGHEHFHDEILQMFEWMNLHKRDFTLKDREFDGEFECASMRPWDNFFWWAELSGFPPKTMVAPAAWTDKPPRAAAIKGRIRENNSITLESPAAHSTVWLSPEFVDFDKRVTINGKAQAILPSLETLLEDARTRADRQHIFWAKIDL